MVTTNVSTRAPVSLADLTGSGPGPERREKSVWKEGSIVSLKMKNFLVYKEAKAIFGPRLNMVVGPNGSGKSTLVCAIALGLGGSPKVREPSLLACVEKQLRWYTALLSARALHSTWMGNGYKRGVGFCQQLQAQRNDESCLFCPLLKYRVHYLRMSSTSTAV